MKRKLVPMMLAGALLFSAAPAQAVTLPMFKQQESDTVTISREEYESYQRYQKLEMLLQLVETYYYEDVDEDAMLENAAVGLMAGIEFYDLKAADVLAACREAGLLVLTAKTRLRLLPPLTLSEHDVDMALEILSDVLGKMEPTAPKEQA